MKKNILIINDSSTLRSKIDRLLNLDRTDVDVTQYNIEKFGWDPLVIQFKDYDLLIIGQTIAGQDIVSWLQNVSKPYAVPPTIFLYKNAARVVADIDKNGIAACLNQSKLTRSLLNKAVSKALKYKDKQQNKQHEPTEISVDTHHSDASFDNLTRPSLAGYTPPDETSRKVRKPRPRSLNVSRKRFSTKQSTVPDIPGYTIIEKIGQGGMSVIYLAERQSDSKEVVVKVLSSGLSENDTQVIRSNQEFALISRINSQHIVKLYDHGVAENSTYTVMEYFSSGDLKQRMSKGITQIEALTFLRQVCAGLAAIHGSGIIHRDLKPANIMFRDDDTLAILDFGISRDINSQLDLTQPGQIIGTPNYMAPEQGTSSYKPDARSDIYSVGVMLYEMLTGNKPYRAANAASIIYKHAHDPIPKLPNQFFEMQGIVDNCMAKFPHQRFQSAIDMIDYINTEFRWDITLDFK